jgi:hypothetical protein
MPKVVQKGAGTFSTSQETFFSRKLKNDKMSFLDQTLFKGYIFCFLISGELIWPERIYNSHYGNGVPAMFTS